MEAAIKIAENETRHVQNFFPLIFTSLPPGGSFISK
jgi:hypothetical protein